jgi:hypothetical protein
MMNAFWASVNFDAFIDFRPSPSHANHTENSSLRRGRLAGADQLALGSGSTKSLRCLAGDLRKKPVSKSLHLVTLKSAWRIDGVIRQSGGKAERKGPHQAACCKIVSDQRAASEHNTLAQDGGLNRVLGRMEPRATVWVDTLDTGGPEPHGPIDLEFFFMDQRVVLQVGWCQQRVQTLEKLWAANWEKVFLHQQFGLEAGISATPIPNGDINPITDEIGKLLRR